MKRKVEKTPASSCARMPLPPFFSSHSHLTSWSKLSHRLLWGNFPLQPLFCEVNTASGNQVVFCIFNTSSLRIIILESELVSVIWLYLTMIYEPDKQDSFIFIKPVEPSGPGGAVKLVLTRKPKQTWHKSQYNGTAGLSFYKVTSPPTPPPHTPAGWQLRCCILG